MPACQLVFIVTHCPFRKRIPDGLDRRNVFVMTENALLVFNPDFLVRMIHTQLFPYLFQYGNGRSGAVRLSRCKFHPPQYLSPNLGITAADLIGAMIFVMKSRFRQWLKELLIDMGGAIKLSGMCCLRHGQRCK